MNDTALRRQVSFVCASRILLSGQFPNVDVGVHNEAYWGMYEHCHSVQQLEQELTSPMAYVTFLHDQASRAYYDLEFLYPRRTTLQFIVDQPDGVFTGGFFERLKWSMRSGDLKKDHVTAIVCGAAMNAMQEYVPEAIKITVKALKDELPLELSTIVASYLNDDDIGDQLLVDLRGKRHKSTSQE